MSMTQAFYHFYVVMRRNFWNHNSPNLRPGSRIISLHILEQSFYHDSTVLLPKKYLYNSVILGMIYYLSVILFYFKDSFDFRRTKKSSFSWLLEKLISALQISHDAINFSAVFSDGTNSHTPRRQTLGFYFWKAKILNYPLLNFAAY